MSLNPTAKAFNPNAAVFIPFGYSSGDTSNNPSPSPPPTNNNSKSNKSNNNANNNSKNNNKNNKSKNNSNNSSNNNTSTAGKNTKKNKKNNNNTGSGNNSLSNSMSNLSINSQQQQQIQQQYYPQHQQPQMAYGQYWQPQLQQYQQQQQQQNGYYVAPQPSFRSQLPPLPTLEDDVKCNYFSMDVECVATGFGHADRSPCSVVIVDYNLKTVLSCLIKPKETIVNYLTEITGCKEGELENGEDLDDVVKKVKECLGPKAILVGQSIQSDIKWMKLTESVDFERIEELSTSFATFNPRYNCVSYFSLEHESSVLLGINLSEKGYHDPADDASASMELFRRYIEPKDFNLLSEVKLRLTQENVRSSFAKRHNYELHGVCMAAFTPSKCKCGQPPLKNPYQ